VGSTLRERLLRLVVFFLCVIVLSISLGMLLSQMHMSVRIAKDVAVGATTVCAVFSYLASYKPGWIFNSWLEASKGD